MSSTRRKTSTALADLIQRKRAELGRDGRPISYEVIAGRSGLPRSTVHALATDGVNELRGDTIERLRVLALALECPPEHLERAALTDLGAHTFRQVGEDEELLLSTWRQLTDDEVEQVSAFMRFLRSDR